jgi:hypothetical protein
MHVTHTLDEVYEVIKPMVNKPSDPRTTVEVDSAVKLLGG